jgi:hypothetical protein
VKDDFLFVDALDRTPLSREEKDGAPPSERRLRRFNLEVISAALTALTLLIAWFFTAWWLFS